QQPHRLLGLVADLVGALGAAREEDRVERLEPLLAAGVAQGRVALQHQQPLLLADLVVVRAGRLARPPLPEPRARALGPERLAPREVADPVALRILGVVAQLRRGEVDSLHALTLATTAGPSRGGRGCLPGRSESAAGR